MYLLMQLGSEPGILQSSPPWNNTALGVPIHRNAYTICTSKFQNFADLSHVQLFTWTFRTKPLGFHDLLLLVISFLLIPKSRNFSVSWVSLQDFLGSWKLFEGDFQPNPIAFSRLPWSMCITGFHFSHVWNASLKFCQTKCNTKIS